MEYRIQISIRVPSKNLREVFLEAVIPEGSDITLYCADSPTPKFVAEKIDTNYLTYRVEKG